MSKTKAPEVLTPLKSRLREVKRDVILHLPTLHKGQNLLVNAFDAINPVTGKLLYPDLRFVVGAIGTKGGKTWGCSTRIVKEAWNNKDSLNWWIAPSYAQAKMARQLVKRLLPRTFSGGQPCYEEYVADNRIVLLEPDGSEHSVIEFKSADNEDLLRGFAVDFFVFDEAARGVDYESYKSVMTTVLKTQGRGIFISTPKGRNWFWEIFEQGCKDLLQPGEEDNFPDWLSIQLPTWSNPTVSMKSIETLRRTLPEEAFKQEVAAAFLLEGAGVFKNIDACTKGVKEPPISGHRYTLGVDLARKRDFTVLTCMNNTKKNVVEFDRFNQISWKLQKEKIVAMARMYKAQVVMDGTGVGDPLVEAVRAEGIPVECYIFGSISKQEAIEKLRSNIEYERISFPYIPALIKELRNYEFDIGSSGRIKYAAPSGQHDDCVISLALANFFADQPPSVHKFRNIRGI
jgi:terminase large subunit-like protein